MKRYIILVIALFFLLLFVFSPLRQVYTPFRYRRFVKHYADKYGLDWLFVSSVIYHESRFKARAQSSAGARGLMQIMPGTGTDTAGRMGINDFSYDSLFNPRINLDMGCYILSSLIKEFNGDKRLVLAAYNAGKGNIYKWHYAAAGGHSYPHGRVRPDYNKIKGYLYPETKRYINKVESTYRLLKFMDRIWRF